MFPFLASQEFLLKKIIFEGQAFSSENKKDFILNVLETYQFLAMLHKNTVNWRNIWDFWSSFKTKIFNVTLCLCHLEGSSIFPTSSYILDIPTTQFTNIIMFRESCFMQFSNGKDNICEILAKKKFDKYNLNMSP